MPTVPVAVLLLLLLSPQAATAQHQPPAALLALLLLLLQVWLQQLLLRLAGLQTTRLACCALLSGTAVCQGCCRGLSGQLRLPYSATQHNTKQHTNMRQSELLYTGFEAKAQIAGSPSAAHCRTPAAWVAASTTFDGGWFQVKRGTRLHPSAVRTDCINTFGGNLEPQSCKAVCSHKTSHPKPHCWFTVQQQHRH